MASEYNRKMRSSLMTSTLIKQHSREKLEKTKPIQLRKWIQNFKVQGGTLADQGGLALPSKPCS